MSAKEDESAEDPASDELALRARPHPITRINRRVLVGVIGLGLLLLAGAMMVALDPPSWRPEAGGPERIAVDRKPIADGIARLPATYGDIASRPPVAAPAEPVGTGAPRLEVADPERDNERSERVRLATQARLSGPFFRLQLKASPAPAASSAAGAPTTQTTAPGQASDLAALTAAAANRVRAQIEGTEPGADATDQTHKLAFLAAGPDKEIYNPHRQETPVSTYQLLAGTLIPASLVTGLNADLPGFVIAQVTEHVYDTVTGRHLLIPQGSRLVGRYDSVIAYGQERALVVWQRIIRPNGSSILVDNLPATDTAGYAGLADSVDLKTWRLLKGIGLATLLGVGSSLAFTSSGSDDSDLIRALRESTGQTTNRAGQRIVERELNVQPTLTVRPGWPLRVIVHKDIVLTPYPQ